MPQIIQLLPFLLSGLIAVTIIDTVGAYTSGVMNFNYGYLAIFSFIVYGFIGYTVSKNFSLNLAFILNLLIGFYDATMRWKLCRLFGANTGMTQEQLEKVNMSTNLASMLLVGFVFTLIGYGLV
jgi:hypothetical protein